MGSSYTPTVNLHSPGPIGDVTPSTIVGTTLSTSTNGVVSAPALIVGDVNMGIYRDASSMSFAVNGEEAVVFYGTGNGRTMQVPRQFAATVYLNTASGDPGLNLGTSGKTIIPSGTALRIGVAATTGLGAGVLAALTNASIVVEDSTGQAYRIPCII